MGEETIQDRAAVSGSCVRCGCALSYISARGADNGLWYCCGACAGSDRCSCGCKAELTRELTSDVYIPTRRMFAARHPDGLNTRDDSQNRGRAFPFADRLRGR
jgi:hypothetical protein